MPQCTHGCDTCRGPGDTCTRCRTNSLVKGRCLRCLDPRCDPRSCPGDPGVCRKCRSKLFRVNPLTKRCERIPTGIQATVADVAWEEGDIVGLQR